MKTYIVVDLEMCNVKDEMLDEFRPYKNELIQIGAVKIDENLKITDTFNTFVHPEFGSITKYITELTGITSSDVAFAPTAANALQEFSNWIPDEATFVAWSENDKLQFEKELIKKDIKIDKLNSFLETAIDCQQEFSYKMHNEGKRYRLSEALQISDISYEDGMHDALVDAKNTAKLFIKMKKEKELKLNPCFSQQGGRRSGVGTSLGALLAAAGF